MKFGMNLTSTKEQFCLEKDKFNTTMYSLAEYEISQHIFAFCGGYYY